MRTQKAEKAKPNSKFENYFAYQEPVAELLKPRELAPLSGDAARVDGGRAGARDGRPARPHRGRRRGIRREEARRRRSGAGAPGRLFEAAACSAPGFRGRAAARARRAHRMRAHVVPSIETEVHKALRDVADDAAIEVFAENIRKLLLAAPFGPKAVLGVDPGLRTGLQARRRRRLGRVRRRERDAPRNTGRQGRRRADARRSGRQGRHPRGRRGQRHRRPRDRELRARGAPGRGPGAGPGRDGERGGRQRVQRQRGRARGVPRARRDGAWRDLHRPAAARSAGGAGEDRSQEHRRRPVPARRLAARAEEEPRRGRRLLREPGRRQPQHRLLSPAVPRLGHRAGAGARHRRAAREGWALSLARRAAGRAALLEARVRAGGRLPAHSGGRAPARQYRRPPRALPGRWSGWPCASGCRRQICWARASSW